MHTKMNCTFCVDVKTHETYSRAMESLDSLYRAFGGPAQVGRAISVSTEHAASMRRRGSIPNVYWQALLSAAKEKGIEGVTLEVLWRIAWRPRRRSRGHFEQQQRGAR